MNDTDEMIEDFNERADDLLAILNGLHIMCQVNEFAKWAQDLYKLDFDNLLIGYQFAIGILMRRLHNEISLNSSLNLTEDRIFNRADSYGIEVHLLPNSCEKTIMLKNIKERTKEVLNSDSWDKFTNSVSQFQKSVIEPLQQIKQFAILKDEYSCCNIDEIIRFCTMNEIFVYMQDVSAQLPHGYPVPTLKSAMWHNAKNHFPYLNKTFVGYKYLVQFVWYNLVEHADSTLCLKTLREANSWKAFDSKYRTIQTEIIDPIETRLGVNLGGTPLILLKKNTKHLFKLLLDEKPPVTPLSEQQILEQLFLWYDIQAIDASKYTRFNGIPTLMRLIEGSIKVNKNYADNKKTLIVKLIHPEGRANLYSYAVFVNLRNYISDASGWILFLECCYDHTGNGISGLNQVEKLLSNLSKKGLLEVCEHQVDKEEFLKLIQSRFIQFPGQLELIHTKNRLDTGRGLSLELLTYYYVSKKYPSHNFEWNYSYSKNNKKIQIDVLVRSDHQLIFIECKLPNDDLIANAILLKKNAKFLITSKDFKAQWNVNEDVYSLFCLAVWEAPSQTIREQLKSQDVQLLVLSEIYHAELENKNQDGKLDNLFNPIVLNNSQPDEPFD